MQNSERTVQQMAEKAKRWLASEKGQREFKKIIKQTQRAKDELAEASRVDLSSLNKPVTR